MTKYYKHTPKNPDAYCCICGKKIIRGNYCIAHQREQIRQIRKLVDFQRPVHQIIKNLETGNSDAPDRPCPGLGHRRGKGLGTDK